MFIAAICLVAVIAISLYGIAAGDAQHIPGDA